MKRHNPLLNKIHKQAGGTFLGLVLGLIIGLTIAVVVALMITKSPIPFVNKVTRQDRPELSPGQTTDPNKPLYGNKDSSPAKSTDNGASNQQDMPVAEQKKPDVTPPVKAVDSNNASNAGSAAKDKQASASKDQGAKDSVSSSSSDDKWSYFLQTGAFREQADAESARAKLALLGFEAQVSERPSDNGNLYRVRIGPIGQTETVNRMRSKLSDNGVDAAVIRIPK
ncbi:cell division protein FtsN [Herbaspirillum sp. Sphag1AN]|nr:cell division protein FtsN [Herbaspirillum sp. Sphag1AN]MBB3247172.1 cell division protein FtsN [Herbaspirillum sp. Sphag64]